MLPAIEEAAALNAAAARAMAAVGVHACTDVSGFGLAGHLGEMLDASGVSARLRLAAVPLHERRARVHRRRGLRRRACAATATSCCRGSAEVDRQDPRVLALFDPQTSGGLLMAVAPADADTLLGELASTGVAGVAVGEVTAGAAGSVALAD